MEEVQEKLGISSDQVKQLVQEGKLREFRDGAKIMFRSDEVEDLSFDLGNLDVKKSEPLPLDDSLSELGLTTDKSGSHTGLDEEAGGLEELSFSDDAGDAEKATPAPAGSDAQPEPYDTGSQFDLESLDADDSIGLAPGDSADQISLDDTQAGKQDPKDDTVVTTHGVNVFDDSEVTDAVDPMAQTQVTPEFDDQISLDSGGSGSGLLDLSREADDTSLGAELLEEIYPGGEEGGGVEAESGPSQLEIPEPEKEETPALAETQAVATVETTRAVQVYDPTSGVFGAMMIVPFLALIYLAFVAAAGLSNTQPALLNSLGDKIWYILGVAAGLVLLILVVGNVMAGKSGQPSQPKTKKIKKPKEKKKKSRK